MHTIFFSFFLLANVTAVSGLNTGLPATEEEDLHKADSAPKEIESVAGPVDLSTDLEKLQGRWKLIYSSGRLLPITLGQTAVSGLNTGLAATEEEDLHKADSAPKEIESVAAGPVDLSTDLEKLPITLGQSAVSGLNTGLAVTEEDLHKPDSAAKEIESVAGPVDLSTDLEKLPITLGQVAEQRQSDHQEFLDNALRRLHALQKELDAIEHQKFLAEAYYRLHALQRDLDAIDLQKPTPSLESAAPIASVPNQPKTDPVKTETKPKREPVAKLKNDKRKDVKLVATARKLSWVVTGSSRTQTRIDNSKNPTKAVKRSYPSTYVTKQPKQDPTKAETKPKKHCATVKVKSDERQNLKVLPTSRKVSKLVSDEREDLKLLATARRVIRTLKTETKPKQYCIAKLKSDEKEDLKLLPTARKPSWVVTSSSQTQKQINDFKNATKGVKRYGPTASVTKQPKLGHVKTETKPKKDCVAKLKAPASVWKF